MTDISSPMNAKPGPNGGPAAFKPPLAQPSGVAAGRGSMWDNLHNIALFRDLGEADCNQLKRSLYRTTLPAERCLLSGDQSSEVVYFLMRGTVKVCIEELDGKDVLLAICGAGETLGEVSAIDGLGHSATVITLERSDFLWMEQGEFCRYVDAMPVLAANLRRTLAARMRHATAQRHALAHYDIPGRVANQLLNFAESYGKANANGDITLQFRLRQGDLAALIGSTRESVNKVLACFRRSGAISIDGHRITLHNLEALREQLRERELE